MSIDNEEQARVDDGDLDQFDYESWFVRLSTVESARLMQAEPRSACIGRFNTVRSRIRTRIK